MPIGTITAILALAEAAYGAYQLIESSNASKAEAHYEIPEAAKRQLAMAEMIAGDKKLPGQDALEAKIAENTASAIKTAKEIGTPTQVLGVLSKLKSKQDESERNLTIAAANNYRNNQLNLAKELGVYAGYEDKKWNLNEYQPYLIAQQKAAQLQASGTQNIFGAATMAAGTAETNKRWDDYMKLMVGDKTTPTIGKNTPGDTYVNDYLISSLTNKKPNKYSSLSSFNKKSVWDLIGEEPAKTINPDYQFYLNE